MERSCRVGRWTCCAVAAVLISGVGAAVTAPASLAAQQSSQASSSSSQWSLSGSNSIDIGYDGTSLTYTVSFTQSGTSLTGTLDDPYYPTSGPITGSVNGDSVTFTFDYPSGSIQGTRTYTGTISSSGAVSGTWTQTGSESPDNGTWSLASNATAGSGSSPTAACTAATQTYDNDQTALNNLLSQLSAAKASQEAEEYRVSTLTREINDDNALIAKYKDLDSASEDDAEIVSNVLEGLVEETALDPKDNPLKKQEEHLQKELQQISDNTLEPEAQAIDSDVADFSFEGAATAESEEAAAAGEAVEAIEATPENGLDRLWLYTLAKDAARIVTADIALKSVLVQLDDLEDQYKAATSVLPSVTDELNADNTLLSGYKADINSLNGQIDAAQAAAQAALEAMTSACQTS
jgi:hypothetical protein